MKNSGRDGAWTNTPYDMSGAWFFRDSLKYTWTSYTCATGKSQFVNGEMVGRENAKVFRTRSDITLVTDPLFKPTSELYAKEPKIFLADFKAV
jgi:catalase (peroxidase I)